MTFSYIQARPINDGNELRHITKRHEHSDLLKGTQGINPREEQLANIHSIIARQEYACNTEPDKRGVSSRQGITCRKKRGVHNLLQSSVNRRAEDLADVLFKRSDWICFEGDGDPERRGLHARQNFQCFKRDLHDTFVVRHEYECEYDKRDLNAIKCRKS